VCLDQALEQPPEDELFGLRVHCWVLVLDGKREVPEPFFIEPLTAQPHPVNSPKYLGIESVWNHRNYWVNMQDCAEGVSVSRSALFLFGGTINVSLLYGRTAHS
jgi:hypothetical protein